MYIAAGRRRTNPINFGEYRMHSSFTGEQERILIRPMKLNSLKCSRTQMVHSIEFKFIMHIILCQTYCVLYIVSNLVNLE